MFDEFYLTEGIKCPNCRKGPDFDVGSNAKHGELEVGEKTLKIVVLHDGKAGIRVLQTKDLENQLANYYFPSLLSGDVVLPEELIPEREKVYYCRKGGEFLLKNGINVYHPCNNCETWWKGSISLKPKVVDGKEAYLTERLVLEGFCEESILPYIEELSESEVYDVSLEQSLTETDEQARQKVIITLTPRLEKCIEAYLHKAEASKVNAEKYLSALNEIAGIAESAGPPYSDCIKRLPEFKEPVLCEGTSQAERLHNALNYMTALQDLEHNAPPTIIASAFLVQFLHNDRITPLLQISDLLQQYESFRAVQDSWLKTMRGGFSCVVNAKIQYYFHDAIISEICQKCAKEIDNLQVPENNDAITEWIYTTRKKLHKAFAAELNNEYEKLLSASASRKEDIMIVEMLKKNGRGHLHDKLSSLLTEKVKKQKSSSGQEDIEFRIFKFSFGR